MIIRLVGDRFEAFLWLVCYRFFYKQITYFNFQYFCYLEERFNCWLVAVGTPFRYSCNAYAQLHNFVSYYDKDKVDREITLFEKPLEFEYQKEFRFYVERLSDKPFVFSIGSLAGIAEVRSAKDIVDSLELKINKNAEN